MTSDMVYLMFAVAVAVAVVVVVVVAVVVKIVMFDVPILPLC